MRTITTVQTIEQMREYEVPEEVFQRAIKNGLDGLYAYLCGDLEERVVSEQVTDEKIIGPPSIVVNPYRNEPV